MGLGPFSETARPVDGIMNRRRMIRLLLAAMSLVLATTASAEPFPRLQELRQRMTDHSDKDRSGRSARSLDWAISRVRERVGARVPSAKTLEKEGTRVHQIRVITDRGRVRRFRIDADTGRFLDGN
jgi:uncharacterized membrane protein YkoI